VGPKGPALVRFLVIKKKNQKKFYFSIWIATPKDGNDFDDNVKLVPYADNLVLQPLQFVC
jgi:hypothetical protein